MLQNKWFKLFVWVSASAFFFLTAALIIAHFNPAPGDKEIMSYMSGMMSSMHGSTMGLSMSIKHHSSLKYIIALSAKITIPLISIAILSGVIVRVRMVKNEK